MIYLLLYSSGLFFTGFTISFAIVSCFLNKKIINIDNPKKSLYKIYENKYPIDQIDLIEQIEQSEFNFDDYFFIDETPHGKVIMKYNDNTTFFEYYSDKHISNRLLEVLCRGFVLKYKCKHIYVNYYNEINNRKKVLEKYNDEEKKLIEKNEQNQDNEDNEANDIFATFKPYNIKKNEKSSTKNDILIKQHYNKFKYLGKIIDYESTKKNDIQNTNETSNISYQKYKTL